MDGSSADLLSFVLGGADLPCLVVSTRRPHVSGQAPTGDLDGTAVIDLGPLAPGAARALLTELRRDDPLPVKALSTMIDRADGNPMLMELLALGEGRSDTMPRDLGAAVRAQIDRLAPAQRTAIQQASVFARAFAPDEAGDLLVGVDWSTVADFIEPAPAGRLRFRHGSVSDAVYAGLAAKQRRAFHDAIAEGLVEAAPESVAATIHFHRAGNHHEAWTRSRIAATVAFERGAFAEAATLFEIALDSSGHLAAVTKKDVAETAELLGDTLLRAGRGEEADRAYATSSDGFRANRDKARLLGKRAMVREREGRYPVALRMLTTAIKSLPKRSGPGDHAPLEYRYASVRFSQAKYLDAIERGEGAAAQAIRAGDEDTLGRARLLLARARSRLEPGAGSDDAEKALEIFEQRGDHLMQASALRHLGVDAYRRGSYGEALDYQDRNAKHREFAGDVIGAAMASYQTAVVLLDQGRLDDAAVALERVRVASRAANSPAGAARSTMKAADIDARRGNTVLALGMLEMAQAQFEEIGADREALESRLAQAEAHLLAGDVEEALATAEKAIEATEGVEGIEPVKLGLHRVRGVALVWIGKGKEGHVQLLGALEAAQGAHSMFEEALVSDALATLYGDDEAAERRDEIIDRLGIIELPPFLTVS